MGKSNKEAKVENPQPEAQQEQQPIGGDFLQTLKEKGTVILEAPTREALAELVDNIPADVKYCVGAVGRKAGGSAYTIQVDTIKN